MPYAELADARLYYERAGSGAPELLFVPGWCCDHTAFRPQFEHFARTASVTALDLRGVGQSDRSAKGYSIPELAGDGDTDLDIFIYDTRDRLVAQGIGLTDRETVRWHVPAAGTYRIGVRNLGGVGNRYQLHTN